METKENSDDLKILKEMLNNKESKNVELSKFSIDNNSNLVSFNYFEDISEDNQEDNSEAKSENSFDKDEKETHQQDVSYRDKLKLNNFKSTEIFESAEKLKKKNLDYGKKLENANQTISQLQKANIIFQYHCKNLSQKLKVQQNHEISLQTLYKEEIAAQKKIAGLYKDIVEVSNLKSVKEINAAKQLQNLINFKTQKFEILEIEHNKLIVKYDQMILDNKFKINELSSKLEKAHKMLKHAKLAQTNQAKFIENLSKHRDSLKNEIDMLKDNCESCKLDLRNEISKELQEQSSEGELINKHHVNKKNQSSDIIILTNNKINNVDKNTKNDLEEQINQLNHYIQTLEEKLKKTSKELKKKQEESSSKSIDIEILKKDVQEKENNIAESKNKELQIRKIAKKYKHQFEDLQKLVKKGKFKNDEFLQTSNNITQVKEELNSQCKEEAHKELLTINFKLNLEVTKLSNELLSFQDEAKNLKKDLESIRKDKNSIQKYAKDLLATANKKIKILMNDKKEYEKEINLLKTKFLPEKSSVTEINPITSTSDRLLKNNLVPADLDSVISSLKILEKTFKQESTENKEIFSDQQINENKEELKVIIKSEVNYSAESALQSQVSQAPNSLKRVTSTDDYNTQLKKIRLIKNLSE